MHQLSLSTKLLEHETNLDDNLNLIVFSNEAGKSILQKSENGSYGKLEENPIAIEAETPITDINNKKDETPIIDTDNKKEETPMTVIDNQKDGTPITDINNKKVETPITDINNNQKDETPITDINDQKDETPITDINKPVFMFTDNAKEQLDEIKEEIDDWYHGTYGIDIKNYAGLKGGDIFKFVGPPKSMIITKAESDSSDENDKCNLNEIGDNLNEIGAKFYADIRFFPTMDCSEVEHEGTTPTESPAMTTPTESSAIPTSTESSAIPTSTESTPSTKSRRLTIKFSKNDKDEYDEEERIKADEFQYDDSDEDMKADEAIKTKGKKRKFTELNDDNDTIAQRAKHNVDTKRRKHNDGSRSSSRESSTSKSKSSSVAGRDEFGDKGRFEDAEEFEMYPDENEYPVHDVDGFVVDEKTEELWVLLLLSDGFGKILENPGFEPLSSRNWPDNIKDMIFRALIEGDGHRIVFE